MDSHAAEQNLRLGSLSEMCKARMLQQHKFVDGNFEYAQTQIARVTRGRCQFFADLPRKVSGFGYADVQIGSSTFQFLSWRAEDVECHTATLRSHEESLMLYIPLRGTFEAKQGSRIAKTQPGDLLFVSSDGELRRRWRGSSFLLNVAVPRKTVSQVLAADFALGPDEPLSFAPFITIDANQAGTLLHFVEMILSDLSSPSPVFADGRAGQHAERAFIHALLRSVPHGHSATSPSEPSVSPFYLKRAEAFIRANLASELEIEDIASAAGVSARTLYYCFRRFRNTTPQQFVKTIRLARAKQTLENARNSRENIADVAVRLGYSNAAQFSKDYKAAYGVTPRQTRTGVV